MAPRRKQAVKNNYFQIEYLILVIYINKTKIK